MKFDFNTFVADAEMALSVAQKMAPTIAALGIPGISPAAALAGALLPAANALLAGSADIETALTTTDQAALSALIDKLNAEAGAEEAQADKDEQAALAK